MATIAHSVGERGVNREGDVRTIQDLINRHARQLAMPALYVNGKIDTRTIAAIKLFQTRVVHLPVADGRIEPGGRTWTVLSGAGGVVLNAPASNLSGAAWWHANQNRYPNSALVSDLEPGFGAKVRLFLAALHHGGVKCDIRATRRNKTRVYLMYYSWAIAKGSIAAVQVPAEHGCPIVWDHSDDARSRHAAQEMVNLFGTVYMPSRKSRHILGLAIDMTIHWHGSVTVRNAAGHDVHLSTPANGSNTTLHAVGASYGVRKLVSDAPHWSDNGH
jgi:hypothetical protein